MRLIIPCKLIPDCTIVCKPTGTKQYVLHQQFPIRFFGENSKEINVEMPKNAKYLVAVAVDFEDKLNVNIVNDEQEFAVLFNSVDEMTDFVNRLECPDQ
jgi:hypothetical protein